MPEITQTQIMASQLRQRQGMPLGAKERMSAIRIGDYLDRFYHHAYVAYSGGKDSEAMLDQVWKINPRIPAVFVDTGLEYPEVVEQVRSHGDRVVWLKPEMPFNQVVKNYGFPVLSKKISMGVSRYRCTKSDVQKKLRLHGGINPTSGKKQDRTIPIKFHHLINAPFEISEKCCDIMKKKPFKAYEKETGRVPIVGTMAQDSELRKQQYMLEGCQSISEGRNQLRPLSFWLEEDVWAYLKKHNVPYSKIYDMGCDRTGCMFCMFGIHMEQGANRFQRMYYTHPKQWNYCINQLGCGAVLDYIGIKYKPDGVQCDMFDDKYEEVV